MTSALPRPRPLPGRLPGPVHAGLRLFAGHLVPSPT